MEGRKKTKQKRETETEKKPNGKMKQQIESRLRGSQQHDDLG